MEPFHYGLAAAISRYVIHMYRITRVQTVGGRIGEHTRSILARSRLQSHILPGVGSIFVGGKRQQRNYSLSVRFKALPQASSWETTVRVFTVHFASVWQCESLTSTGAA